MPKADRVVAVAQGLVLIVLALAIPAMALSAGADEEGSASPVRVSRWESDLSIGGVSNGRIGIVKSVWYFALPKILAVGLSFDYIAEVIPLSIDVALNAPIPIVVPFVCAGAGTSVTVGGITNYGGGLKVRLGKRFGIIAEYRRYHYQMDTNVNPPIREKHAADYFGAGIAWIY